MLALLALLLPVAFAKSISTPYLTFEVPPTYNCETQEAHYQCQDTQGPRMKDSILIVTFKRIGPQDSVDEYMSRLSKPFTRLNKSGPPSLSQVISTSKLSINNWEWASGKHFESDLTNYFTYYWTTARGSVAMMVKYSVLKKSEQARQKDIQTIANSLLTKDVKFSPALSALPNQAATPTAAAIPSTATSAGVVQNVMSMPPMKRYVIFAIIACLVLVVGYAILKK